MSDSFQMVLVWQAPNDHLKSYLQLNDRVDITACFS
jgi:hypothetical protein